MRLIRSIIPKKTAAAALCGLALAAAAPMAQALNVSDVAGDFLASYSGAKGGDLDVINSFVTYNALTDVFVFAGTLNADIGTTPGAFYVFGINRGTGTAPFAAIGAGNVVFDSVVRFNADGSGTVTGTTPPTQLPIGTVKVFGSTIIGTISGSLLPSKGFAKTDYTWNLWPRLSGVAGLSAISDFAPNNAMVPVTPLNAVPEPASVALLALGLGVVAMARRRHKSAAA
ncbi:hypothetical protein BH11PSE10_BH11PSE10_18020 [soil metagenome]